MSNINIEKVIKNIDMKAVENDRKNGKSLEEIIKGIDLRPIIKAEMVEKNPNVEDKEVDSVVKGIDLVKVMSDLLTKSGYSVAGNAFEDLTADDMMALQGAGDVDAEITPTITTSSLPCLGAISGVSSAVLSYAKC